MPTTTRKLYIAEFLGTFCLVFTGTGAVVIHDVSGEVITHLGIALTFGLIVMAMIYTIGDVSGAHINPAVTIAFWGARRFQGGMVVPYIIAQCLGALLASGLLRVMFPVHETYGATLPAGSIWQTFLMEVILTWMLMFVILSVSTGAKEKGITAAIAVGGTVGLMAIFAGPISGASMNPARSLGPAVVAMNVSELWIYLTAPVVGALLAIPSCMCIREESCCTGQSAEC